MGNEGCFTLKNSYISSRIVLPWSSITLAAVLILGVTALSHSSFSSDDSTSKLFLSGTAHETLIPLQKAYGQTQKQEQATGKKTWDSSHLRVPDISMTPKSGPPGTTVTIEIENIPDVSDEPYPYPDFYFYFPFAKKLGTQVLGNCNGQPCIPVYTYEDAQRNDFADRTISFTLVSKQNPQPEYRGGVISSVCDVQVNSEPKIRLSNTCNMNNQPQGDYDVQFAWGTKSGKYDVVKTIMFTVTPPEPKAEKKVQHPVNIAIEQYQQGKINEREFDQKLADLGYTNVEIRHIKAVMGKLPHQTTDYEQKEAVRRGIEKAKELASARITIPDWIKRNAGWWSEDKIGAKDFASGIEYLIKEDVINVPKPQQDDRDLQQGDGDKTKEGPQIPDWIKRNAGWWSTNKISNKEFVSAIQYLIKTNIISV